MYFVLGFNDLQIKPRSIGSHLDKKHRKLCSIIIFLGKTRRYQIYFLLTVSFFAVTELFHVEPPQLDLAYLELNEAPMAKKTGDIFDDVKFFRKTYR